ncbi:hypothetical protein LguiB_007123 [Lonicera macranthoides]
MATLLIRSSRLEQLYDSVEHRVTVNSKKERFSIMFFFHPVHHICYGGAFA